MQQRLALALALPLALPLAVQAARSLCEVLPGACYMLCCAVQTSGT